MITDYFTTAIDKGNTKQLEVTKLSTWYQPVKFPELHAPCEPHQGLSPVDVQWHLLPLAFYPYLEIYVGC